MIRIASVLLIFVGISLMIYELFVPVPVTEYGTVVANHISGLILLSIGLIVIGVRIRTVGVGGLLELPKENKIQCFTSPGRSVNTQVVEGDLLEDNLIKAGKKIIHYKGGGFRIAGHECVRVHGNVIPNIPEWLGETLARYKEKYGVENIYELRRLHDQLLNLTTTQDLIPQLQAIPELASVIDDKKKLRDFADMSIKDIRTMAETLYDGTTVRMDPDIDEFIQTATPAQVHQYAVREYMSAKNRDKFTRDKKQSDMMKYALPIAIIMFLLMLGGGIILMFGGG